MLPMLSSAGKMSVGMQPSTRLAQPNLILIVAGGPLVSKRPKMVFNETSRSISVPKVQTLKSHRFPYEQWIYMFVFLLAPNLETHTPWCPMLFRVEKAIDFHAPREIRGRLTSGDASGIQHEAFTISTDSCQCLVLRYCCSALFSPNRAPLGTKRAPLKSTFEV